MAVVPGQFFITHESHDQLANCIRIPDPLTVARSNQVSSWKNLWKSLGISIEMFSDQEIPARSSVLGIERRGMLIREKKRELDDLIAQIAKFVADREVSLADGLELRSLRTTGSQSGDFRS